MTEKTLPDWIAPGSEVVRVHQDGDMLSRVLTIDRVLKRDIVLSDGDRFSRRRLSPKGSFVYSNPARPPFVRLYPADAPEVKDWRSRLWKRDRSMQLGYRFQEAVIREDWDTAHSLHEKIGELLNSRKRARTWE